jgi:hypothetical protein
LPQPNGILNNLGYPFGLVGTCCATVYHARLTSHPCVTKTPTTQFHATLSPRTLSKTDCGYLVAHSLHRWLGLFQIPPSRSVEFHIQSTYNHVLRYITHAIDQLPLTMCAISQSYSAEKQRHWSSSLSGEEIIDNSNDPERPVSITGLPRTWFSNSIAHAMRSLVNQNILY